MSSTREIYSDLRKSRRASAAAALVGGRARPARETRTRRSKLDKRAKMVRERERERECV